jgi:hypothetical protein
MNRIEVTLEYQNTSVVDREPKGWPFSSETLFAEKLTEDTAKIITIPFCQNTVAPGDIVRIKDGIIVEILEKTASAYYVFVNSDDGEAIPKVTSYLANYNIVIDRLGEKWLGIAVPASIKEDELEIILSNCEIKLERP